jgi:hypothetical protein
MRIGKIELNGQLANLYQQHLYGDLSFCHGSLLLFREPAKLAILCAGNIVILALVLFNCIIKAVVTMECELLIF